MPEVVELQAVKPVFDQDAERVLLDALELVRKGELRDFILIGALPGNAIYNTGVFEDRFLLLGALEYAKVQVASS